MNFIPTITIFAFWICGSLAHMSMQFPYPRDTLDGTSYAVWQQNEPMVSVHPTVCHGLDEDSSIRNAYSAGDSVEIDLYGTASHNGGHCSFWWTTDESSDWYKIIDIKDCTILADGAVKVIMPYTMSTECETKCTFAWSWSPVSSGACEVYMNCAEISVSGVTGVVAGEAITVNFDDIIDGTCVRVDETTHWTTLFGTVKTNYTSSDLNGGTTGDGDSVTVDDTDISDDIASEDGALCSNENAINLDGLIADNGTCGTLCSTCRCDDGQCCSEYGYCGPTVAYYLENGTALYYKTFTPTITYYESAEAAFEAYCDNNQGDWRLVECETDSTSNSNKITIFNIFGIITNLFIVIFASMLGIKHF